MQVRSSKPKIALVIPSKSRWENPVSWNQLPKRWKKKAFIVTYKSEKSEYSKIADYGKVIARPKSLEGRGVNPCRQWIMEKFLNDGFQRVIFMDDDLEFCSRECQGESMTKADKKEVGKMLDTIESQLDEVAFCGITGRFMSHTMPSPYLENCKACTLQAMRLDIAIEEDIRWDRTPLMADSDILLQLLSKGYNTRMLTDFAWNQKLDRDGGLRGFRTKEKMRFAAELMVRLHPGVCKLRECKTPRSWKDEGETHAELTVSWKKAFIPSGSSLL